MAHDQEVLSWNPGTVYWTDVSNNASCYIKEKFKKPIEAQQKKIRTLKSYQAEQ